MCMEVVQIMCHLKYKDQRRRLLYFINQTLLVWSVLYNFNREVMIWLDG